MKTEKKCSLKLRFTQCIIPLLLLFQSISVNAQNFPFSNKVVKIENGFSKKALCTMHWSKDAKSNLNQEAIIQYSYTGDPTHHWIIEPIGGNLYVIKNEHSNKVLCTMNWSKDAKSKNNQEKIIQYDYYGDPTQKWSFTKSGDKWLIRNSHSGKVLCTMHWSKDAKSQNNQEGIIQYDSYGDVTQAWIFTEVNVAPKKVFTLANKFVKIENKHSGKVLCTMHWSKDERSNNNQEAIIQYSYTEDPTHIWQFKPVGDGLYKIENAQSEKVLCTMHWSKDDKSKRNQEAIIQYDYYGDATQKWKVIDAGNDSWIVSNAFSNRVLCTMHWSKDAKSKNNQEAIIQYDSYGDPTQYWNITEVATPSKYSQHMTVAVNRVDKGSGTTVIGAFFQVGFSQWEESREGLANRIWIESHRDEWSVYLNDGNANIRLDLHTEKIYYSTNTIAEREQYNLLNPSNEVNGYMVSLLDYSLKNSTEKFGEFCRVSNLHWKEINKDGVFNFKQINRDEWSVYLYDSSRDIHIQLDLHTKQVYFKLGNNPRSEMYVIRRTYGFNQAAEAGIINFPGTNQSITNEGLQRALEEDGLYLVKTDKLEENQCAIFYPNADRSDLSAQFGVLACNKRINGELSANIQVVNGVCDLSNYGIGSNCSVTAGKIDVEFVKDDGGINTYSLTGPSVGECTSISLDRLCASMGGSLAGIGFEDENGNGIGMSLDAGIGGGLAAGYEDGVLSVNFDLKIGIGASLSLSANLAELVENPVSGLLTLAETGYLISGGVVRLASGPIKSVLSDVLGDAAVIPNTAITIVVDCPWDLIESFFKWEEPDCLD